MSVRSGRLFYTVFCGLSVVVFFILVGQSRYLTRLPNIFVKANDAVKESQGLLDDGGKHLDTLKGKSSTHSRSSMGVPGMIRSCGKIFDNFHYTYQYKVSSQKDCEKTIRLSPKELPLTALASYPGSGNTWLRYLLQQATGLATGSMYCDLYLKTNGFFAESVRNGSVIAVKTHLFRDKHLDHFKLAILLIRDPRDALLADFNRENTQSHTGQASDKLFSERWDLYWFKRIQKWETFHREWLKFRGKLILVHYGCLRTNFSAEMRRILEFLGLPYSAGKLNCLELRQQGHYQRMKNDTVAGRRQIELREKYNDVTLRKMRERIAMDVGYSKQNKDILNQFLNITCHT